MFEEKDGRNGYQKVLVWYALLVELGAYQFTLGCVRWFLLYPIECQILSYYKSCEI